MGKVEIELNSEGIQEMLKSSEIMAELKKQGSRMVSSLGSGYAMDEHIGKTRGNVSVFTTTPEAYKDNLENNSLLKAVSK